MCNLCWCDVFDASELQQLLVALAQLCRNQRSINNLKWKKPPACVPFNFISSLITPLSKIISMEVHNLSTQNGNRDACIVGLHVPPISIFFFIERWKVCKGERPTHKRSNVPARDTPVMGPDLTIKIRTLVH